MCIQELSTCKQYHIPMKIINLNNRSLGMVQRGVLLRQPSYGCAAGFREAPRPGHVGMKIERAGDVEGAEGSDQTQGSPGVHGFHHR